MKKKTKQTSKTENVGLIAGRYTRRRVSSSSLQVQRYTTYSMFWVPLPNANSASYSRGRVYTVYGILYHVILHENTIAVTANGVMERGDGPGGCERQLTLDRKSEVPLTLQVCVKSHSRLSGNTHTWYTHYFTQRWVLIGRFQPSSRHINKNKNTRY